MSGMTLHDLVRGMAAGMRLSDECCWCGAAWDQADPQVWHLAHESDCELGALLAAVVGTGEHGIEAAMT